MSKPIVNWVPVDLAMPKKDLPKPLSGQSGGTFWIVLDGGIHGKHMAPAWWTGENFDGFNNEIITHFAKVEFPEFPAEEKGHA